MLSKKVLKFVLLVSLCLSAIQFSGSFISVNAEETYTISSENLLAYLMWTRWGFTYHQNAASQISINGDIVGIDEITLDDGRLRFSTQNKLHQFECIPADQNSNHTKYSCRYLNANGNPIGNSVYTETQEYTNTIGGFYLNGQDSVNEQITLGGYVKNPSFEIPFMTIAEYNHPDTNTNSNQTVFIGAKSHLYLAYIASQNPYNVNKYESDAVSNNHLKIWSSFNQTGFIVNKIVNSELRGGPVYNVLDIYNPNNQRDWIYIDFAKWSGMVSVVPIYIGDGTNLNDDQRQQFGIPTQIGQQLETQHEQMMNTDQVSEELPSVSEGLVNQSNEKFENLLYPIKWVAEEGQALTNAPATGQVELPAIFSDNGETWILDLTVIETNLPTAWAFIQGISRLAVASWLMMGLFNLFRGNET